MIIRSVSQIKSPSLFFQLDEFVPASAYVKLEGLNIAGSIKLTTALGLIAGLENDNKITPESQLIESSSGNLGVALSIVCKEKKYSFMCVTDPNILPENERLMKLYGAEVIKITERDENGGYLGSRIKFIKNRLENDKRCIWLNQYANENNPAAHYSCTAEEILKEFPKVDYLFIGAGTTGTLMGCARKFKEKSPHTKIIAVDSVGSVTFGAEPKKRYVPGLGTSRKPEIANKEDLDEILYVHELDGIQMCHELLTRYGLLLGGSSGSVLHGVKTYPKYHSKESIVVAISPDFGYKYADMIYNPSWIEEKFNHMATN